MLLFVLTAFSSYHSRPVVDGTGERTVGFSEAVPGEGQAAPCFGRKTFAAVHFRPEPGGKTRRVGGACGAFFRLLLKGLLCLFWVLVKGLLK